MAVCRLLIKVLTTVFFFFKFEYANEGDKDNKLNSYMVCQINKNGTIETNQVSSKVPYLSLRSSRSSLTSSALTGTGQGCHLEAGPGDFPQATMKGRQEEYFSRLQNFPPSPKLN